ncbi:MAG: SpoIIE family protein phosphatase [Leptospiraceae bacterium]|nr:SpoIIE family protein phosphatase [Leptospiraceae bacterium]
MNDADHNVQHRLVEKNNSGQLIFNNWSREVHYILDLALDETRSMVKANQANFYFYNREGRLQPYKSEDTAPGLTALATYCARDHTSIRYNPADRSDLPEELHNLELEHPALGVSLTAQEGDLGVLVLAQPLFFSEFYETDLNLVKNFSASFSIFLNSGWQNLSSEEIYLNFKSGMLMLFESAHLHQQMRDANYRLRAVLEVSNLINSSRELNEMIEKVLYSCRRVMRAHSASMFLVDEETRELYFAIIANKADENLKGLRIPEGQGIVGLCAQQKKSIVVNDAANDPRIYRHVDEVSQNVTRNLIAAPLLVNDRCIGVIEVINTIDRQAFSRNDLQLFESFSDSVAIALQRRILLDELQVSNQELEKKLRETSTMHEVARVLVEATDTHDMFEKALQIIHRNLNIQRLSVLMHDPETDTLHREAWLGDYSDVDRIYNVHETLSGVAFRENRTLFINDLRSEPEYNQYAREDRYATGSCILIPLVGSKNKSEPIGVFCASDPQPGLFHSDEGRLLATLTSQLVRGLENFELNEEILARQAIEKEVEITSRIQQNILPTKMPNHLHLKMGARSVMARTTGGDFYDYFEQSPNGPVTLLVADVSGKSLPAALFMAVSSSILRTIMRFETEPTAILARANDLLYKESESGMFVTVFLARYEPDSGRLHYASAGHNQMILMHVDGSYQMLSGRGHPLGVIPSYQQKYEGGSVNIKENDQLILYTDGVVEAQNPNLDEYGLEKFIEHLQSNIYRTPGEIIDLMYNSIVSFSGSELQFDDFTMMITRFHGAIQGVRNYHIRLPAHKNSIPEFRDRIMQICMSHGLSGNDLDDILLVADEAATNIVVHAYEGLNLENPEFNCDLQIESNNYIRLQFSDRGRPFNFGDVRTPSVRDNLSGKRKGGFGVYLMKSLMEKVDYSRQNDVNYLVAERSLKKNLN